MKNSSKFLEMSTLSTVSAPVLTRYLVEPPQGAAHGRPDAQVPPSRSHHDVAT